MNGRTPSRPVRVLFLAWGYSIHARRRIELFTSDRSFEVAVASTHAYGFADAWNIPLTGAAPEADGDARSAGTGFPAWLRRAAGAVRYRATAPARRILGRNTLLGEIARSAKDLRILRRAARSFRPDVVFLQTLLYPCYLAYFLPRRLPVIVTFWNGDVTWWARWNGVERRFKKRIVLHGVRRAGAITVNSRAAHDACLEYGTGPEKIHVIRYPGVDLARFRRSSKEEARSRLRTGDRRIVLCPRGLGGFLNSDVIVEAAVRVVAACPETLFLFLSGNGGEEEREKHARRASELGIDGNCRFEGQVPWESMPQYYAASDVMVSVSQNDSLPNCMLEAMGCGVPVIMGDIPPIREWVSDGVNGLLVPPRDPAALAEAVLRVFGDPDGSMDRFVERNLETVRREFDARRNAEVIKELVRAHAGH